MCTSLTAENKQIDPGNEMPLQKNHSSRCYPARSSRFNPPAPDDAVLNHYKKSVSFSGHMHTMPSHVQPFSQVASPTMSPDPKGRS